MADIFGRERHEYLHYAALSDDLFERHQAAHAEFFSRNFDVPPTIRHNFNALGSIQERAGVNAQALAYVTDNLLAFTGAIEEILYTGYRADEMVPFRMDISEGASSYTPRVVDVTGRAKFLTSPGLEAEAVRINESIDPQPMITGGVDAEWTREDIRNASHTGLPLQSLTLESAVERCYDHIEKVALVGDTDLGWHGLSTLTSADDDITVGTNAAKTFANSTALEIQALISGEISALITDSNEVIGRRLKDNLCVYLPGTQYDILCNPLGDNADKSIMDWLERMNPFTKMTGNAIKFKRLMELNAKMITTVMSDRVFEIGMSITPRIIKILDNGRVITGQLEYKIGRLYIKRPKYIRQIGGL